MKAGEAVGAYVLERELVLEAGTRKLRMGRGLSERELRSLQRTLETWIEPARSAAGLRSS